MIQKYKYHIILISILKLSIIFLMPLTGDEAYFIKWANHLSLGYYDHPPMVGWLIYFMQFISHSYITFRLFSFFTLYIVAYFIYKILLELNTTKEDAIFSSLVFILAPIDILILLFTNDIPLLLFGIFGVYFLLKSFRTNWLSNSFFSAIFFGLSFLSKYFAVFLMLGLLIYIIKVYKTKSIKHIVVVVLVLIPFIGENLYFNYNSCWNNIMFNFFARTDNLHYNISTIAGYIAILIYLMTPWGIYYFLKSTPRKNKKALQFVIYSVMVGLGVFLIVSLKKKIGLHWLLLFMPYLMMLFIYIHQQYRTKMLQYTLKFTYLHIFLLLGILIFPLSTLSQSKQYKDILLFTQTKKICTELDKYENIFTTGYTSASILSYHCNKDIKMILNNSKYGRLDDKLVNIKDLTKTTIYIFYMKKPSEKKLKTLFENIKIDSFVVMDKQFFVVKATNLNYKIYKEKYLDIQQQRFYNIPKWLPVGQCYFLDRYY